MSHFSTYSSAVCSTVDPAQQLRSCEAQIESLLQQLQSAQRRAAVGTMVAMVAHEFNNILTPVLNYAQLARRRPDLAQKAVEKAADGSQRASDICRALLEITRESDAEPAEVHLADVVDRTLTAMARDPAKDAIELTVHVPPDLRLSTRPVELQQVLLNLLMNARTAVLGRQGLREIAVEAEADEADVRVRVRDNGVGIAAEDLPRIFEPHFSTRPTSNEEDPGGHGLGLTVCRQIVEGLGGRIEVDSRPGDGAIFTLVLPAETACS